MRKINSCRQGIIICLCTLYSFFCQSQTIENKKYLILSEPVRVEATLTDIDPHQCGFDVTVSYKTDSFDFSTSVWVEKSSPDLAAVANNLAGWKSGYLFIHRGCGGGNAWRCDTEEVLAIRDGMLKDLGEVSTYFSRGTEYKPGASMEDDYFVDVNNALEMVSCHACAPAVKIILKERNGQLMEDSRLTWKANKKIFDQSLDIVKKWHKSKERERLQEVGDAILFVALASKFCDKDRLYKKIISYAKEWFVEGTFEEFFIPKMNDCYGIKQIHELREHPELMP